MLLLNRHNRDLKGTVICGMAFILFLVSVFGCICGCAGPGSDIKVSGVSEVSVKPYNVILIVVDSIRADHLSCYGYHRKTTPAIDNLAKEGILFKQAIAQSTWSLPAHCSIMTSRYVPSHGVIEINKKLDDSELTLAEILKLYGYKTAAFNGGFWIGPVFNTGQGFDIYQGEPTFGKLRDTVPLAIRWIERNKGERFFLFLQGFDGHSPFNLPKAYEEMYADPDYEGVFKTMTLDHRIGDRLFGYDFFLDYEHKKKSRVTEEDIDYIIAQYDGSVAHADRYIGVFLKKLKELGVDDNTIIILTSYHGTPLFEHGIILRRKHGGGTDGTVRVPLIIRHPGINGKGRIIDNQVQHIDIMPTVLDLLGVPINYRAQGKSLLPLIDGSAAADFNKYVYSSGYKEMTIRTSNWKLINTGREDGQRFELYNLKRDPLEQNNLIGKEERITPILKHELEEWLMRAKADSQRSNSIPEYEIDKIKKEMVGAGYWFITPPKDKIVFGRETPSEIASENQEKDQKAGE